MDIVADWPAGKLTASSVLVVVFVVIAGLFLMSHRAFELGLIKYIFIALSNEKTRLIQIVAINFHN